MSGRKAYDPRGGLRESDGRRNALCDRLAASAASSTAAFASAVDALSAPNKNAPALDLLGDPIDPRHGLVGRPRHTPGDRQRAKVAELHAAGLGQHEIAAALGITAPTLRLNYPIELGSRSQVWRRRLTDNGDDNG